MKKYFSLLFLLPCLQNVNAQITTSLVLNQPSATITEWMNNATVTYVVNVLDTVTRPVLIKAELKSADGAVIATKDLSKAQAFNLARGVRVFFAKDVLPLEITQFSGSYKAILMKTGKLPAGTYQLSVQLVNFQNFAPITAEQTKIFNLVAPQLPYLIVPVQGATLQARKAETAIIFRWTPLLPKTAEMPFYRLQVFEVLSYQQPLQALRGNQPLLDITLKGQTQYNWRPQMSFTVDSIPKRFIWTIQTLNGNQQPFIQTASNGESRSEPFLFFIGKDPIVAPGR
ncbi:MAG: hypothetical protein JWP69_683 [Flaviaesturariibacter sp.]|nr:hypothetical protein [Flaviaesturariibacter sp.]